MVGLRSDKKNLKLKHGCNATATIKVAPDESLCSGSYAPVLPANQFNTKKFSLTITRWDVDVDHGVDVDVDEVDVDVDVDVDDEVDVDVDVDVLVYSSKVR